MPICKVCKKDLFLSAALGVCADCIKNSWEQARPIVAEVHKASRERPRLEKGFWSCKN